MKMAEKFITERRAKQRLVMRKNFDGRLDNFECFDRRTTLLQKIIENNEIRILRLLSPNETSTI